ncbi:MAG: hypothetical protein WAK60_02845 [Sedimentisphaerales bacterium]
MHPVTEVITLITAIVGLITAIVYSYITRRSIKAKTTELEMKLAELEIKLKDLQIKGLNLKITSLKKGDHIKELIFTVKGTYKSLIPSSYSFWVLGRKNDLFYLMNPRIHFNDVNNTFYQNNVRLMEEGPWDILIIMAHTEATKWFQSRVENEIWEGFQELPNDTNILDTVSVEREKITNILGLSVSKPKDDDIIREQVFEEMEGKIENSLQSGYVLWVLAKNQYHYFLQNPPIAIVGNNWSQKNIRLSTPGRWELHIYLASNSADRWFKDRAESRNWGGFDRLPRGAEILVSITVHRKWDEGYVDIHMEPIPSEIKRRLNITIKSPQSFKRINRTIYNDMEGKLKGLLPQDYKLFVFKRYDNQYHMTFPEVEIQPSKSSFIRRPRWRKPSISLTSAGEWELHVCLVSREGEKWIEERRKMKDWSGFEQLPTGISSMSYVRVTRVESESEKIPE